MAFSVYEATNFDVNIANDDNFKSFKYKAKLSESTAAANGILRNTQMLYRHNI